MKYLLSLGSNIGDRSANITTALDLLQQRGIAVEAVSSFYRTTPVDCPPQDDFVNAAAVVETPLGPEELLDAIGAVESALGRVRVVKNGPRTIDIDIVFGESGPYRSARVELPHPRWQKRLFVIEPAREIADRFAPFAQALAARNADTGTIEEQMIEKLVTGGNP
jgi:2-amino-4-hydroxy-6-hydroxymethyldihydropteridine diphosphokinase